MIFCDQRPKKPSCIIYIYSVLLGFGRAQNIGIYSLAPSVSKIRKNTAYMTIFRGRQKCDNNLCCQVRKRKQQQQQEEEEQEEEEEEEHAQQCAKKMCGRMVTCCGMTRTSHCALHMRARAGHMNNTNAHTTIHSIHSPYGIAGVRSATICTICQRLSTVIPYANSRRMRSVLAGAHHASTHQGIQPVILGSTPLSFRVKVVSELLGSAGLLLCSFFGLVLL